MTKRHLVVATRESPLALRQAEWVKNQLHLIHPHLTIEFLGITTEADRRLEVNLTTIGGKGLFVKELEAALLDGRADIAVHSMKDVPMDLPPDLIVPVICEREDARDVFVSKQYNSIREMKHEAVVGTSSLRRQIQLRAYRSDLKMSDLRGNINTRLTKLDKGQYDGLILAAAGLIRMQLQNRICEYIDTDTMLPAAGQGALGIECREGDMQTQRLIAPLNHLNTFQCVTAERATCRYLGGGCTVPIAAYAKIHHDELLLSALIAGKNGLRIARATHEGHAAKAEQIGIEVAKMLEAQGAREILREYQ